jgi:hypothetical protein
MLGLANGFPALTQLNLNWFAAWVLEGQRWTA